MKLEQAKAKNTSENPFYGYRGLLQMQRYFEKVIDANANQAEVNKHLDEAWKEVSKQEDSAPRELFFMIMFSVGDISNREHNMFANVKVDQGGQSKRKTFFYCLQWLLRMKSEQFYNFLPIIAEYTNYENLFYNQLRTDRNKGTLIAQLHLPVDYSKIATYLGTKFRDPNTTTFEMATIAKFLPKVPSSKRYRKTKEGKIEARAKKPHTVAKDKRTIELIRAICKEMDWTIVTHKNNTAYPDYQKFRSIHMKNSEAHLFSTHGIMELSKVDFLLWLEGLPAGARYRTQCRLVDKNEQGKLVSSAKWFNGDKEDLGKIYLQWMEDKEKAMKKVLALTEEDKQSMTKDELKSLLKQAKTTTGGETIFDTFLSMYSGSSTLYMNSELNVKLQTLIDKVKVNVPVMVVVDNSGSMSGSISAGNGKSVDRLQFAKLICAIMMYKNPNPDLGTMMMTFNSHATVYYDDSTIETKAGINKFVQSDTVKKVKVDRLADRTKPFSETFAKINSLFQTAGSTDLTTVSSELRRWVNEVPALAQSRKEAIQEFPVWLVISDGDLNSHYGGAASMAAFKHDMLSYFGATPVVVLWDIVDERGGQRASTFENMENMIHLAGFNPAILNQVFMNIDDLDVIDVFITLDTLYKSSRYKPVVPFVL